MVTDLHPMVAWLRDELAREERVALAAAGHEWQVRQHQHDQTRLAPMTVARSWLNVETFATELEANMSGRDGDPTWHYVIDSEGGNVGPDEETMRYIADHDPRSTLARVEAERRILDLHSEDRVLGATPHAYDPIARQAWTEAFRAWAEGGYVGPEPPGTQWTYHCTTCEPVEGSPTIGYPCSTLRALAAGHRWSPGFQAAWLDEAEVGT